MPYPGYTGWTVVIDDPLIATGRTALDINNPQVSGIAIGTTGGGATLDWGTAQITEYLAQQGKYGSSVADYVIPNRTITIPIGVGMDVGGSVDAETALRNLSMKVGTIQREGGWLRRQRKGGPNLYADIVDAQLTGVEAWMETANVEPNITLTLTCLPDFYGDEITLDTIHCSGYCTGILSSGGVPADIQGDYPARCRMLVSGSVPLQYGLTWGVVSEGYTPAPSLPTSHPTLAIFASSLYSSFSGTAIVSDAGSYNGHTLRVTLPSGEFGVFSEPLGPAVNQFVFSGVGTFNVWARCNVNTGSGSNLPSITLEYFVNGSSGTVSLPSVMVPASGGYYLVNLGPITVPPVPSDLTVGSGDAVPPFFSFAMLAYSPVGSQTLSVDVVFLQPVSESAGILVPSGTSTNAILGTGGAGATTGVLRSEGVFGYGTTLIPSLGDLLRLPPSGVEGRPCQLFLKLSQALIGAPDGPPEDVAIDNYVVVPKYRPCYLTRP